MGKNIGGNNDNNKNYKHGTIATNEESITERTPEGLIDGHMKNVLKNRNLSKDIK